jgi:hypothetical protein
MTVTLSPARGFDGLTVGVPTLGLAACAAGTSARDSSATAQTKMAGMAARKARIPGINDPPSLDTPHARTAAPYRNIRST